MAATLGTELKELKEKLQTVQKILKVYVIPPVQPGTVIDDVFVKVNELLAALEKVGG